MKKLSTSGERVKNLLAQLPAKLQSDFEYCFMKPIDGPVNNVEMRVVGMSRSGNHPIINWIGLQFPGKRVCLLNSAQPKTNPFVTGYSGGEGYTIFFNNFMVNKKWEQRQLFRKKDCLIYSYEDAPLQEVIAEDFEVNRETWIGKSLKRYDLLVLRDPFNLFASRLRLRAKFNERPDVQRKIPGLVNLWKDYAKEYLRKTNHLKNNLVTISYNSWFSSVDYRRDLANKLEIPFTDRGIEKVVSVGTGSSFDGQEFCRKAGEMKVLERWRHFVDDKFYRSIFKDIELVELSDEIFGKIPGTEILFEE